jgi:accessory gene regulator B
MVDKSARYITDSIISEGLIAENLKDWYVYSFTRTIEMAINVGTIMLLSVLLQNTVTTILFLLFFNILRQRTGGFHCNEFWQCYIVTSKFFGMFNHEGLCVLDRMAI